MKFFNLHKLCSLYKIVIIIEIILAVIGVVLTLEDSHGLSIAYFGLFFFLSIVPQCILAEMGLLIDKLANNQEPEED